MSQAISAVRRSYRELADGTLRVQFDIEPNFKNDFLAMFPEIDSLAAIAPLNLSNHVSHGTNGYGQDYGQYFKNLFQSQFLLQPQVLKMLGTDDEYRAWIQTKKCIICQKQNYVEETGEMKCEAAHVRRADAFGMGMKAEFACVPLCRQHHGLQHLKGESAIGGQVFVEKNRDRYLREWGWMQLKKTFSTDSMKEIDPEVLYAWAENHDISALLP